MGKIIEILSVAQSRAKDMNLPYEGSLMPEEAYTILQMAPGGGVEGVGQRATADAVVEGLRTDILDELP